MPPPPSFPVDAVRRRFPGLARREDGRPAVFLDGPAGSQVPADVAAAVSHALLHVSANVGAAFATSREATAMLRAAREAAADLLHAPDADEIVLGPNMTSLAFALSRSLATRWAPGDRVVVTRLDHDANVTPWTMAARAAGVEVRTVRVEPHDCSLDLEDLRAAVDDRTRLLAVTAASNLVGTKTPVAEIARIAHRRGALLFVDAVHLAPHELLDVQEQDADFVACSAYKWFGPHVGVLWGRKRLLADLPAAKVRPAPDTVPDRWLVGTQNHEGIAGVAAAVEYLAGLGGQGSRRERLRAAFAAIGEHERGLCRRLLQGLAGLEGTTVVGIADPDRVADRTPTVALHTPDAAPEALARRLAARGIFAWAGNSYALPLTEALGLEPEGVLRVGLLHYNTAAEVDRLLAELPRCIAAAAGVGAEPGASGGDAR